jgi:hypothetical protein
MKTLRVVILTLAMSALLSLASLGVQAQGSSNAMLKLMPIPPTESAAHQVDLVTAIRKVAERLSGGESLLLLPRSYQRLRSGSRLG